MLHERATTDHSALASLGPSAAVFLPGDDGCAVAIHEASAPPHAVEALGHLRHDAAIAALPADALGEDGLCPDARPLLAGVPAPVCALGRVEGGLVALLAWGPGRARPRLGPAFGALAEMARPHASRPSPFEEAFEHAAQVMLVLGGDRRIHAVNRAGRALLAQAGVLTESSGRLRVPDPAGRPRPGRRAGGRMRPAGVAAGGGGRGPGLRCEIGRIERPLAARGGVRFLLTAAPRRRRPSIEALLTGRYGLTPSEARLAGELAAGRDLRGAGERLGVSHHTARKYLQIVFSKMGVHRQADLVRRALQLMRDPGRGLRGAQAPAARGCAARSRR